MSYTISKSDRNIKGTIKLDGSKSISNRVLIIRALCGEDFEIENLSTSDDSKAMLKALQQAQGTAATIDVGAAGTTMRFLTAYLSNKSGEWILTGSERMKQRPIAVLVDALRTLGADIEYLENDGYPPLKVIGKKMEGGKVEINAGVSSQYLSALLMIAPVLQKGLKLQLKGDLVSKPYLTMTLNIMNNFEVQSKWLNDQTIFVASQSYQAKPFFVESDWSAASYHYALAAFGEEVDLSLEGLLAESLQGDSVLPEMMQAFGVETVYGDKVVHLTKKKSELTSFEYDFVECPDIAQTLAVVCGGLKVEGIFSGLVTLSIKETDRTAALQEELAKFGISFQQKQADEWVLTFSENSASSPSNIEELIEVKTYHDHRMAMAFAPLAMVRSAFKIENPMVVTKSYPVFWEDLKTLGFSLNNP
ncbi:MAG: 3-phosphoshikimate 1-carboxyvinyltransferase [Chitinophagales bacterium]